MSYITNYTAIARRINKSNSKSEIRKNMVILNEANESAPLEDVTIFVNWKKSRTWGMIPKVEATINGKTYRASASGYGYDKLSAAVAEALYQSPSFIRFMIENWRKIQNRLSDYNKSYVSWTKLDTFPQFRLSGTGISVLRTIVEAAGYNFEHNDRPGYDYISFWK